MDKFSTPPIRRQPASSADNPEGMWRNEPLQARCRLAGSGAVWRLRVEGVSLKHQGPHDDPLARRMALRDPSTPLDAACRATRR